MLATTTERVDPRVTRTRKLLVDAFLGLMAEKAFEDITVQDIAARATVNRATFYAHFSDKYALVDELMREGFAQLLKARMAMPGDTVQAHLRRLFLAVTDHWTAINGHCKHSYRVFEPLVEAQVKLQLREEVHNWLLEHNTSHASRGQQLELVATIVSASMYATALQWGQSGGKQSAEAFADVALPLIASSITALD